MPKIYLQEKITPIPGKYLVIGTDGNLMAGDLPEGVYPIINITFPEGTTNLTARCGNLTVPITSIGNTSAVCYPTQFGTWTISGYDSNGNLISDNILISDILIYSVTLRYIAPPAVYDLTQNIPAATDLVENDILNCPYSGSYITLNLLAGTYKLECWGASGGDSIYSSSVSYRGGPGGYVTGNLILTGASTLYLYCGQKGYDQTAFLPSSTTEVAYEQGSSHVEAWNGGGPVYYDSNTLLPRLYQSSGGGATDIRLNGAASTNRIIVAGAGGGAFTWSSGIISPGSIGGYGGGLEGGGFQNCIGGSQTSGGTGVSGANAGNALRGGFGGESYTSGGITYRYFGSSGGGGYYGGAGNNYKQYIAYSTKMRVPGAGGSSYISPSLDSSYTIAGDSTITEPDGSSNTGHNGNGYIRITVLSLVGE